MVTIIPSTSAADDRKSSSARTALGIESRMGQHPTHVPRRARFRQGEKWDTNPFWLQPIITNPTHFDSPDYRQNFTGIWTTYRSSPGRHSTSTC